MAPGTRVTILRGGHRGKKATVVECPDIDLGLFVGDQLAGRLSLRAIVRDSHLVWIEFDDKSILGGKWGSGAFEYRQDKIKEFNALDELAAL